MRKAFTLIELLVVIAILAVLAVAVVLALNPAGLLQEARDSNRISDMATIKSAVGIWQADGGTALGSAGSVYVSIPDSAATSTAGTNCAAVGLAASTSGVPYHCGMSASSTFRATNGTGWIPVNFASASMGSPFALLPVDPVNSTSSNLYYTWLADGAGNWKAFAQMESAKYQATALADGGTLPGSFETGSNLAIADYAFPSGWVQVPGNGTFGTNTFWAMQYDAKCIGGNVPLGGAAYDTGYMTYANNSYPCTSASGKYVASAQSGYPMANIAQSGDGSHNDAVTYCQSIGAHLMTNAEWQTIAWNVENVASNWSNGIVGGGGTGYMPRGNSDSYSPGSGYAQSDGSQYGYLNGSTSTWNTDFTHLRTLTLSNSSTIWDMAGNVWQWTNNTILDTQEPHGTATGWNWYEFTDVGMNWNSMSQSTVGAASSSWNAAQGIGRLYSDNGGSGGNYGFLRGGAWSAGMSAGVGTLDLAAGPGTVGGGIGFRCAR